MSDFSLLREIKKPPEGGSIYNLLCADAYKISSNRATGETSNPEIIPC